MWSKRLWLIGLCAMAPQASWAAFILLASTSYDGPASGDDVARAITLDPSGNIIVAGDESTSGSGSNWRVRKYNPSLTTLLATTDYSSAAGGDDVANGVTTDPAGNVIAVGFGSQLVGPAVAAFWHVRKYDSSLSTLLASTTYVDAIGQVA